MLDVCLLGTGGMMPLPGRYLTSLYLRYNGNGLLIDCGEGTQITMRKHGISSHNINTILLTHFHADHVSGLPGLLLTMGNADRTEPVTVIGPKGAGRVLSAVRVLAPELPFEIRVRELAGTEESFSIDGMTISAFRVNHNVTCYGYAVEISRQGRFDVSAAKENEIPLQFWNRLQKGETIPYDGRILTPSLVLGPERKGIKLIYSTDTRPHPAIASHAEGADLAILEGMYGEDEREDKARQYKHMTMLEAAGIASEAGVKELWLTHFSPSNVHPENSLSAVTKIFSNTKIPKDGQSVTLRFPEDEA